MGKRTSENRFADLSGSANFLLGIHIFRQLAATAMVSVLAACSTAPRAPISSPLTSTANQANVASAPASTRPLPILPPAGSGRGGYYQDDGPGDHPPEGLLDLPDPIPKVEPYSLTGNKPYVVFGKTYTPLVDQQPFKQRGVGSWYGKKFHGQKTSSGELYDMYKLTAAHPTLPIPSYARVTNLSSGVQVIVRINDRGPFHSSRIIDLSYTAALKLGYLGKGSSELEVERLLPDDIARVNGERKVQLGVPTAVVTTASEQTSVEQPPLALAVPLPDTRLAEQKPLEFNATAVLGSAMPDAPKPGADVASGYYLQLGAFGEAANAEAARSRLMQNWDNSLPPLQVSNVGVFFRLHSGPFSSRAEAANAAQKLQSLSEIKAMIVQR